MNKIFKAYAKLIEVFHKMYEDRNTDLQETSDFRVTHIRANFEGKLKEKIEEWEQLLKANKNLEAELALQKNENIKINESYWKVHKDNQRMRYLMLNNSNVYTAMKDDVEFYKYRLQEIKDKYQESSSDEEDNVKKVIQKYKPKDKQTDVNDLFEYINGVGIDEYVNQEEIDSDLQEIDDAYNKVKQRKLPVTVEIQTDPPQNKNFCVQIENGEHVIPFVDRRSKSAPYQNIELIENKNE